MEEKKERKGSGALTKGISIMCQTLLEISQNIQECVVGEKKTEGHISTPDKFQFPHHFAFLSPIDL